MGNSGTFHTIISRGSQIIISDAASVEVKQNQSGLQIIYLYQVDLMLSTEGLHQLDIHGLVTVGSKGAQMSLTPARYNQTLSKYPFTKLVLKK